MRTVQTDSDIYDLFACPFGRRAVFMISENHTEDNNSYFDETEQMDVHAVLGNDDEGRAAFRSPAESDAAEALDETDTINLGEHAGGAALQAAAKSDAAEALDETDTIDLGEIGRRAALRARGPEESAESETKGAGRGDADDFISGDADEGMDGEPEDASSAEMEMPGESAEEDLSVGSPEELTYHDGGNFTGDKAENIPGKTEEVLSDTDEDADAEGFEEDEENAGPAKRRRPVLRAALAAAGVIAAAALFFAGIQLYRYIQLQRVLGTFAQIGVQFPLDGAMGEDKIRAVGDARAEALAAEIAAQEKAEREKKRQEALLAMEKAKAKTIELRLISIQKDLKIKFVDQKTGSVVPDVTWKCSVTDPSGKRVEYTNDDQDGIIYKKNLAAGTYQVAMLPFDKTDEDYRYYTFSTDPKSIEVKDTIEYARVDVSDEVKTESQVNVAKEDTEHQQKQAVQSAITDTVEYVESTKTEVGEGEDGFASDEDTYEAVPKSEVPAPGTSAALDHIPAPDCILALERKLALDRNPAPDRIPAQEQIPALDCIPAEKSAYLSAAVRAEQTSPVLSADVSSAGQSTDQSAGGQNTDQASPTLTVSIDGGDRTIRTTSVSLHASVSASDGGQAACTWKTDGGNGTLDRTDGTDVTLSFTGSSTPTVTVTAAEGNLSATAQAVIQYNAAQVTNIVSVIPSSVSLSVGVTRQIRASVETSDGGKAQDQSVTYTSSDSGIATVSTDGLITAAAPGTCTITVAMAGDSAVSSDISVTVTGSSEPLRDADGKQLYIKTADGTYKPASASDYDLYDTFYRLSAGKKKYRYTGWQTLSGKTYYFDKNGKAVTGKQIIQGITYQFGEDGSLTKSASAVLGIDVSRWNGSIDWNAVKNAGVRYAIIRCGYRGSGTGALVQDSMFKTNLAGAKAAGLKVGAYFFSQAVDEAEAVEEASMALSVVGGSGLDYPIFLDVESSGGRGDAIDAATRTAVVRAFCATIQNSGRRAGVYANTTWLSQKMNAGQLTAYTIWLAQYAPAPTYSATRIDLWQYSSAGKIDGISGNVDLNQSYME